MRKASVKFSHFLILIATLLAILSVSAWAKPQTIILDLPTMNCPTCPITVKKALNKIDGVREVSVSYEKKQAVVTFEDTKTNASVLILATTNAGYPSSVIIAP